MPLTAQRLRELQESQPQPSTSEADLSAILDHHAPKHLKKTSPTSPMSSFIHAPDTVDVSWTEQWPFPEFDPTDNLRRTHRPRASRRKKPKAKIATAVAPEKESDVEEIGSCSSSDAEILNVIQPHPLSSDWILHRAARQTGSGLGFGEEKTKKSHSAKNRPGIASPKVLSRQISSCSVPPAVDPSSTITKQEVTALMSIFDTNNALGGRVEMRHMDLEWMVRKVKLSSNGLALTVTPPGVHLHLGNIAGSLQNNSVKERQILINSPRSAIVMLRNGVTMNDLKKASTSLDCEIVEKKPFVTMDQLTWEQKRYLAIETARQSKLRQVVTEYHRVCQNLSFDEIVSFCNQYRPDRPSSAKLLEFAGQGEPRVRRSPQEQCDEKYQKLLDRFQRREAKIDRSGLIQQARLEEDERQVIAQIVKAEEKASTAVQARIDHVRNQGIASRGRSELWRSQRNRHDRVETFRHMVGRETLLRRLDEVTAVQAGMKQVLKKFKDTVMRHDSVFRLEREQEHSKTLAKSRALFLRTQK